MIVGPIRILQNTECEVERSTFLKLSEPEHSQNIRSIYLITKNGYGKNILVTSRSCHDRLNYYDFEQYRNRAPRFRYDYKFRDIDCEHNRHHATIANSQALALYLE